MPRFGTATMAGLLKETTADARSESKPAKVRLAKAGNADREETELLIA